MMLTSIVVRITSFCLRHAVAVVVVALALAAAAAAYAATHFAINSDIDALLSKSLSWRQREVVFESEFRRYELIDVVVDAPTPELTAAATTALTDALAKDTAHFRSATNSSAIQFFTEHGLLFQPKDALEKTIGGLTQAQPLIEDLATDPSLRGLVSTLEDVLIGVKQNKVTLDSAAPTLNAFSDTLDDILAGRPASFSWRVRLAGKPAESFEKRGVIEVRPV
ncbi:MAG: hopanoid biosynthesis-associated RND transporter HpnN, partial [Hyphomicrobiales bacterium]|nr:hopanoid biosynthesis-associated RND transporter HpnN [Hyphomicrobiales bacterium]